MVQAQHKKAKKSAGSPLGHGVGRRKSAVARAWLRRGKGALMVNGVDYSSYFDTAVTQSDAYAPLLVVPHGKQYDVEINVSGGGKVAQAGAAKLAIARAFLEQSSEIKPLLRQEGMLTVDSRVKERKKYGQRGARRKFQFVKR